MDLVRQVQLEADQASTLRTYTGLMRQMQRFFSAEGRVIFYEPGNEIDGVIPVTANELMMFCEVEKRSKKPDIRASSLESFRSAAIKFRQLNGFPPFPPEEELELSRYFKGVKNQYSTMVRQGTARSEEGRRHLTELEYQKLCKLALKTDSVDPKNLTELHLSLVLTWNLTCRGETTASINAKHLLFEGDALKIGIAKSKRSSEEIGTFYNIYGNHIDPACCPILSLAVHCATFRDILMEEKPLFHQSKSQNKGIAKLFASLLDSLLDDVFNDVGFHSVRKGSITKGAAGSPEGAPWAAIACRARWKIQEKKAGTVYERYIKFDDASDKYLGRILAGLSFQDSSFASLPVHFLSTELSTLDELPEIELESIEKLRKITFGDIPNPKLKRLSYYLLASLLYNLDFLRENLKENHPFWKSNFHLRSHRDDIKLAKNLLRGADIKKETPMKAMGVPHTVVLLEKVNTLQSKVQRIEQLQADTNKEMLKLVELIPLSAAASGMMVGERQLHALHDSLQESIRVGFANLSSQHLSQLPVEIEESKEQSFDGRVWTWGGKHRFIPESFPMESLAAGMEVQWAMWWLGVQLPENNIRSRPLRVILVKHRQDLVDLVRLKLNDRKKTQQMSRTISEICHVMNWLNTLKECDTIESEDQLTQNWLTLWPKAQAILSSLRRNDNGNVQAAKRRKHDDSRIGIRSVYQKLLNR